MKQKTIGVIMILLVLLTSCAAAEDLTALTDEELAALNHRVQLEMFRRSVTGKDGVIVPAGEYYIGVDIPAGRYEVSVADDVPYTEVAIYRAVSMMPDFADESVIIGTVNGLSQRAVITLKEGDRISMYAHNTIFKAFAGLF